MAKIPRIQFKRTKNPGVKPSKDNLAEGELAINLADRMLFTKSGEEIIDLGFAKGGTVNGNIIQETGNFTTNGVLTVQSPINPGINFLKTDTNEYLRLETKNNEGLFIFGDGGQAKAFVKLPKETGTIATREWSNSNKVDKKGDTISGQLTWDKKPLNTYAQHIESTASDDATAKNFIRKFRNRTGGYLWHELVDENGLSYYTGLSPDKLHVQLGISGVRIDGGASYEFNGNVSKAGIDATVNAGSFATWESRPSLIQMRCQANNGVSSLFKILSHTGKPIGAFHGYSPNGEKNGAIFSFQHGNKTVDYHDGGMTIKSGNIEVSNGTYSKFNLIDSSRNNLASLVINDNGIPFLEWKTSGALKGQLFMSSGNVATREWVQDIHYNKSESDNRYVHLGTGGNIRLHSYKQGGHGYSSWNENNTRVGYVGFGSDGSTEFTINNEKSNGSINLRAKDVQTNGSTIASQPWVLSNFYKKTETYNKSEIDGKVNGRLTQSQADGRYVRMDLTNLGKQYTPAETIASGKWGRPIGFSTMTHPNTPNKPSGITGYGYWHVIAGRDQGNGYAGFFTEHGGGRVFYGRGETGGANPTWSKVYTEASKPTPGEIGAYTKGETYSRAEVDSRVNGRLTQATADGRYAYKGGATGQNFGANIVDAADVNIRSDISVKSNLVYIKNALDLLKPLTGYKYDLRLNDNTHKQSVGIIAQDVQKVLPELVQKDSTDLLSVNYNGLTAVLINAVNELNNRLKELEVKKWQ